MEWILVVVGLFFLFGIISWIRDAFADAKLYRTLKPQLDALNSEKEKFAEEKKDTYEHIEKITSHRSMGFPWLAVAYADYFDLRDVKLADYLTPKQQLA